MQTEELISKRRRGTLEAAVALVDDLEHIRMVLANEDPTPGDVRRLSAQLRRILVERDIARIAAPRIGQPTLLAPDLKPIYVSNRKMPFAFFAAAGVSIFGISIAAPMVERAGGARNMPDYSPDLFLPLGIESFLKQNVICFEGNWVQRSDIIKYIANIAHGVHSGTIRNSTETLIRRVRHVWRMSIENGTPNITANVDAFSTIELPANVDRKSVDCVLLEVFATAAHLTNSPDIKKLEEIISVEMGVQQP